MRVVALSLILSLLAVGSATGEPQVVRDVEFTRASGQRLTLDLHLPATADQPPLVIWIHGGAWVGGSKSNCPVLWLVEHGYAVASISYRFSDRAIFPAQIHDCKAAVRWLRANASSYGYDGERIAAAGASAGGMLAALLGTSGEVGALEGGGLAAGLDPPHSSRVQAVIDYYGATDFVLRSRTQPKRANHPSSPVFKLFGGGVDQRLELARLASAVTHVSADDPPLLVLHGGRDTVVLPDQSLAIARVYREVGLDVEHVQLPDAGHGGREFYSGLQRARVLRFLQRTLPKD